jgi:hypothetical protein
MIVKVEHRNGSAILIAHTEGIINPVIALPDIMGTCVVRMDAEPTIEAALTAGRTYLHRTIEQDLASAQDDPLMLDYWRREYRLTTN